MALGQGLGRHREGPQEATPAAARVSFPLCHIPRDDDNADHWVCLGSTVCQAALDAGQPFSTLPQPLSEHMPVLHWRDKSRLRDEGTLALSSLDALLLGCNQGRHFRMSIRTCLHTENKPSSGRSCGSYRSAKAGLWRGKAGPLCTPAGCSCGEQGRLSGGQDELQGATRRKARSSGYRSGGRLRGDSSSVCSQASQRPWAMGRQQEAATVNWSVQGFRSCCILSGYFLLTGGAAFPSLSDLTSPRCRAELIGVDRGQKPPSWQRCLPGKL